MNCLGMSSEEAATSKHKVTHVIFDLDGILVRVFDFCSFAHQVKLENE